MCPRAGASLLVYVLGPGMPGGRAAVVLGLVFQEEYSFLHIYKYVH